jgi:hypothetical protein
MAMAMCGTKLSSLQRLGGVDQAAEAVGGDDHLGEEHDERRNDEADAATGQLRRQRRRQHNPIERPAPRSTGRRPTTPASAEASAEPVMATSSTRTFGKGAPPGGPRWRLSAA